MENGCSPTIMPLHTVRSACANSIAQKMVAVFDHRPYSPDLAPADFSLFPRLKVAIKGARFANVNVIKDHVKAVLRSIPQEAFADCLRELYEPCQTCVVADGDYFEGQ